MPKGILTSGKNKGWFKKGHKLRVGVPAANPFPKGNTYGSLNKGRKRPELAERNKKRMKKDVSYKGIHQWVNRNFEKVDKCEFCGIKQKRLHWSNKDHLYSRDRNDWQKLCARCHKAYDIGRNLR